jgi:hypothetical protein
VGRRRAAITMDYTEADPCAQREGSPEVDEPYRNQCLAQVRSRCSV